MVSVIKVDQWQNSLGQNYTTPIQVVSKTYADATGTSAVQSYVSVSNGSLSITSKMANSAFLIRITANGYMDSAIGVNLGISRTIGGTTTRLMGVDGGNGDTWMGANHNSSHASSWNMTKECLDFPNVAAGTTITFSTLVGKWGSGVVGVNWDGATYGSKSTITVMEIAQ